MDLRSGRTAAVVAGLALVAAAVVAVPLLGGDEVDRVVPAAAATATATATVGTGGPSLTWTGVRLCHVLDGTCREAGPEVAAELDAVLDRLTPSAGNVLYDCVVLPVDHTVQFQHPSARTLPYVVPSACNDVRLGQRLFRLDQPGRDAVVAAYQAQ